MSRERCPNCGSRMTMLREQHQTAGDRKLWLRWLICPGCRHVLLDDWSFVDDEPPNEADTQSTIADGATFQDRGT